MTKDEIKALIAHGIEGQGSAIDLGGVLPKILNGIIGLLDAKVISFKLDNESLHEEITDEELREITGYTFKEIAEADICVINRYDDIYTLLRVSRRDSVQERSTILFGGSFDLDVKAGGYFAVRQVSPQQYTIEFQGLD